MTACSMWWRFYSRVMCSIVLVVSIVNGDAFQRTICSGPCTMPVTCSSSHHWNWFGAFTAWPTWRTRWNHSRCTSSTVMMTRTPSSVETAPIARCSTPFASEKSTREERWLFPLPKEKQLRMWVSEKVYNEKKTLLEKAAIGLRALDTWCQIVQSMRYIPSCARSYCAGTEASTTEQPPLLELHLDDLLVCEQSQQNEIKRDPRPSSKNQQRNEKKNNWSFVVTYIPSCRRYCQSIV